MAVHLIGTAFILTGCKASGPDMSWIFETRADPIEVGVVLDTDKTVEAVIPVEGGTLSATGADGTLYTLEIPSDALLNETTISLTPVTSVSDMPFGGEQTYAVQLGPEGLFLNNFAILTITPAEEIPLNEQIVFGYQEEGKDLILAAPVLDSSEIKIQVLHFSGSGVTKGLLADIEPVRQRLGGAVERRLENALNEALIRSKQEGGEVEAVVEAFTKTWREYEEQVIKPRLAAAGESCAAGRLALQTVLGHERQKELLGAGGGGLVGTLIDNGLMDTVSEVCMKEEYELCRDEHILHRIIPAWLGDWRQYALLGAAEEGAPIRPVEEAKEYVRKCLTFEMQFASQMSFDDGSGGGYTSSVESKIKLQINPDDLSTKGQAPLVNTAFEFIVTDCSVTNNRGGGTFEAMDLAYVEDTKSPTDVLGYVRDLVFIFYPGDTSESFTLSCEDQPPYTSPPSPLWTGAFLVLHQVEMSQASGGFVFENWEILGDEYYAKREWIGEDAGLGITEAGTLKLYHLPE
jgi:hypothetical protein